MVSGLPTGVVTLLFTDRPTLRGLLWTSPNDPAGDAVTQAPPRLNGDDVEPVGLHDLWQSLVALALDSVTLAEAAVLARHATRRSLLRLRRGQREGEGADREQARRRRSRRVTTLRLLAVRRPPLRKPAVTTHASCSKASPRSPQRAIVVAATRAAAAVRFRTPSFS
jgi:hypothetical protein